jgi:CMP/dCMP kinase
VYLATVNSQTKQIMKKQKIITIDGPAASGKSTTARMIARLLDWQYLDTGAMYRAIGLAMLDAEINPADQFAVCKQLDQCTVDLGEGEPPQVLLNGKDVSKRIRDTDVSQASSKVATLACVRAKLVEAQRRIGSNRPCVIEGRDTGTVVFPDAGLKIYLDAPARQRAKRRLNEMGDDRVSLTDVMREVEVRDERDRNRTHSPLVRADDAEVVNTGALTVEQQVRKVLDLAQARFGGEL